MLAAAPPRHFVMPAPTRIRSATRWCSPSSRARTGAGATSMRRMSEPSGEAATPRVILAGHPLPLEETPDTIGAYPRLSEQQIGMLDALGERRSSQPGEVLVHDGDKWADFFVVLTGQVAIVEAYGCAEEQLIAVHGPGRFLGELSLLTGQAALYSAGA